MAGNRMDTDDLTNMAYQTITLAHDVSEFLRAEIGASASDVSSEDEFLRGTVEFLAEVLEDPEDYLDSWNAVEETNVACFAHGVRRLQVHVLKTMETPQMQRGGRLFD